MRTRAEFVRDVAVFGALAPFIGCATAPERPLRGGIPADIGFDDKRKVVKREIFVGADSPFRALHISDTHLAFMSPGDLAEADEGRRWLYERRKDRFPDALFSVAAALDYARREHSALFHTGDLVDYVSAENLRLAEEALKGMDVLAAPGNHEYNWHMRARPWNEDLSAFRARVAPHFPNAMDCVARTVNGVNFIAFDNGDYNVSSEQAARIDAELDRGLPSVLLCHVPFFTRELFDEVRSWRSTWDILRYGGGRLAYLMGATDADMADYPENRRIEQHASDVTLGFVERCRHRRNLKAILCGHLHRETCARFSPTAVEYVADANFKGVCYDITFI